MHPIERFHPFSDETKFGKLEFLGGLHVASDDPHFGGLSGIRVIGDRMVAISDAGYWFDARLVRTDGRLTGLTDMRTTPMLDENGREFRAKWEIDAEGLERVEDAWLVSTERDLRVALYQSDPFAMPVEARTVMRPPTGLRGNRGLEAIVRQGPTAGEVIAISEDSLDADGNIRAFALKTYGRTKAPRELSIRKRGVYGITDAASLARGDILLLERRFSLAAGLGMRIRRIDGRTVAAGAVLDGEVLIEVSLPHQIDNMEGLAVSPHPEGHRLTLVSDDNRSLLQRTLVLEFLLRE